MSDADGELEWGLAAVDTAKPAASQSTDLNGTAESRERRELINKNCFSDPT